MDLELVQRPDISSILTHGTRAYRVEPVDGELLVGVSGREDDDEGEDEGEEPSVTRDHPRMKGCDPEFDFHLDELDDDGLYAYQRLGETFEREVADSGMHLPPWSQLQQSYSYLK